MSTEETRAQVAKAKDAVKRDLKAKAVEVSTKTVELDKLEAELDELAYLAAEDLGMTYADVGDWLGSTSYEAGYRIRRHRTRTAPADNAQAKTAKKAPAKKGAGK